MKRILILTFLLLVVGKSYSQETGNDSYTIQRLIIYNNAGEVLLEKHKNGWMTPAIRHNTKVSTNEGLSNIASEFGLIISPPKLAGIFMFIPEYKPQASFRQHFICNQMEGELKLPDGKLDVKWFSPNKAIEMMSLPETKLIFAVRDMTKQVLDYPKIIWGGTYSLWKEDGVTKYTMVENFYPLAEKD